MHGSLPQMTGGRRRPCYMHRQENRSKKANEMKALLPFLLVIACIGPAQAQTEAGENLNSTTRTMASLLTEGYEPQTVQLFKDKIWMRKDIAGGLAFICDRG